MRKRYGDVWALRGITFHVERGEVFTLLGPNGAGKTTLMRIIAEGISYEGKVLIQGKDIEKCRHMIGYCPQEGVIYDDLTVTENIDFYARLHRVRKEGARALLDKFKIPHNRKGRELSGGMRKKLSLAIAILGEPLLVAFNWRTRRG